MPTRTSGHGVRAHAEPGALHGEHLALHEPGRHDRWTWLARRLVQEELIQESNDGAQRLYLRESGRRFLDSPWPLDYAG